MRMTLGWAVALMALSTMPARWLAAQEEAAAETATPARLSREELREKQLDVSFEARDVESILTKLKRASDLSKTLIGEVAQTTEEVSAALDRGDSQLAQTDSRLAAEKFREIAKLLEALLTEETPPRIAAARDLAKGLAKLERQLAEELKREMNPDHENGGGKATGKPREKSTSRGSSAAAAENENKDQEKGKNSEPSANPGESTDDPTDDSSKDGSRGSQKKTDESPEKGENKGGGTDGASEEKPDQPGEGGRTKEKPESKKDTSKSGGDESLTKEERLEALTNQADKLARDGLILEDILKVLSETAEPEDLEKGEKIAALVKETKLLEAIESMQDAAESIRDGKLADVRLSAMDTADRMEVTARRLDALYRAVVAPQVEELRQLEQAMTQLHEKLDELETQAQIAAWHRDAKGLLNQAESLGVDETLLNAWMEQLESHRLDAANIGNVFHWELADGRFVPPEDYAEPLVRVQEEIQVQIQALLLNDLTSAADENTPPKYQELVERYYRVLSRDTAKSEPEGTVQNSDPAAKPGSKSQRKTSSTP